MTIIVFVSTDERRPALCARMCGQLYNRTTRGQFCSPAVLEPT